MVKLKYTNMRTLKKVRELEGLMQQEVAERCGITTQQVRNIEAGRSFPRRSTQEKIEKGLFAEIAWAATFAEGILNEKKEFE